MLFLCILKITAMLASERVIAGSMRCQTTSRNMPVVMAPYEFIAVRVPRMLEEARVVEIAFTPIPSSMSETRPGGASMGTRERLSLATQ